LFVWYGESSIIGVEVYPCFYETTMFTNLPTTGAFKGFGVLFIKDPALSLRSPKLNDDGLSLLG